MGAGQRRTTEIARGLFAVRYVGADDAAQPPHVKITTEPESKPYIDVILHPDHEEAVLSHPGTSLIVRAMRPGTLAIEVEPSRVNGSIAATVNIEPLIQGEAVAPAVGPRQHVLEGRDAELAADLRLLGHIAGIGDVHAGANEWLAGPTAPSRIEGISIEWPTKPDGVDIRYSVKTAQPLNISGRIVDLGAFVGTRGRAMALTGLMFELSGPDAALYQFSAEALFLGSPVMRVSGERVVVSGRPAVSPGWVAGGDPGNEQSGRPSYWSNQPRQSNQKNKLRRQPGSSPQGPMAAGEGRPSGRVRVFRSRPKEKPTT